jgi:hypothetical protein
MTGSRAFTTGAWEGKSRWTLPIGPKSNMFSLLIPINSSLGFFQKSDLAALGGAKGDQDSPQRHGGHTEDFLFVPPRRDKQKDSVLKPFHTKHHGQILLLVPGLQKLIYKQRSVMNWI